LDTASNTTVPGVTISGLTASTALALDSGKVVVSVTNTGSGNNVLATSPTLVTPALGTPSALVGTNITGTASGLSIGGNAATATTATNQSGGTVSATSITDSGNLNFTGTGNRITGDFSNGTVANRVWYQTSTANTSTIFDVVPSGTGVAARGHFYNSSDPSNASVLQVGIQAGGSNAIINSTIAGTGTYLPITFLTGGSERVRVDTSGNVGIGTSSPAVKLDVQTTSNEILKLTATTGTSGAYQTINNTGGPFYIGRDSSTGGAFGFAAYAAVLSSSGAYPMCFGTQGIERMRIDTSGDLLVGRTTQVSSGQYSADFPGTSKRGAVYNNTESFTASNFVSFSDRGTVVGTIAQNGASTVNYSTSSDYRLKNTIAPMTGALAKVALLKPVTYKWNVDGSDGQGFIAHELQEVVEGCVTGEKDAVDAEGNPQYQGIDTSFLVATLTAAIQELKAIVDAQAVEIAALKAI
jgi:hypothetical protein